MTTRAIGAATRGKNAVQISGTKRLFAQLASRSLKGKVKANLQVGYSARYAIYVHENLNIKHPQHSTHNCGGQAKFLEIPVRRLRKQMALIIRNTILAKNGLVQGMLKAGQLLLQESQKLVPVDTGYLKRSGYARIR